MPATTSVVRRPPGSSSLYDILDLILDKGLVIDAYARVSLIGIDVVTIDARVVVASVDTYLRFAEAVDRLAIHDEGTGLVEIMSGAASRGRGRRRRDTDEGRGVLTRAKEAVAERVEGLRERLTDDEEE
jgi:hypothetical protein